MRGEVWEQLGQSGAKDLTRAGHCKAEHGKGLDGTSWEVLLCGHPLCVSFPGPLVLAAPQGDEGHGNIHLERKKMQTDLRPLPVSKALLVVERGFGKGPGGAGQGEMGCGAAVSQTPSPEEAALSQIPLTSCLHTNVILS